MHRPACVDIPSFPLQLLVRKNPEWIDYPAAVVSCDTPQGEILQASRSARRSGILPGQRYASALSLCPDLRAGVISKEDIAEGVTLVIGRLDRFTPAVEPMEEEPGVFEADASGLERIHETLGDWAGAVRDDLAEVGLRCTVAVGFTRFGAYALARARRGIVIPDTPAAEVAVARATPLESMGLSPATRDGLAKLKIRTVGQLLSLPPDGLLERLGREAHHLFHMARGTSWHPLTPHRIPTVPTRRFEMDFPDSDTTRLLFLIKRLLSPLLEETAARGHALSTLLIELKLDHAPAREEAIQTASPTLDQAQLLDLTRLKLEALDLEAGVVELVLAAETVPATPDQLRLFCEHAGRDPEAADRAFARIKARFGRDSVVRARLSEGHLPEARFRWEPMPPTPPFAPVAPRHNEPSKETARSGPALARRILTRPVAMNTRPVHGPRGVHLRGLEHEPVVKVTGPYIVSGGWWHREQHREYHFAETSDGKILWIYFDRNRRRWYLHGTVE